MANSRRSTAVPDPKNKRRSWGASVSGWIIVALLLAVAVYVYSTLNREIERSGAESVVELINVEILNGCGEDGIARVWKEKLESMNPGFVIRVVNMDNVPGKKYAYNETLVIDRMCPEDRFDSAEKIRALIPVSDENFLRQRYAHNDYEVYVTVVLGNDHKKFL